MTMGRAVGVLIMDILQGRPDTVSLRDVTVVSGVISSFQTRPMTPPTMPLVLSRVGLGDMILFPGVLAGDGEDAKVLELLALLRVALSRVWLLLLSGLGVGDSRPPKLAVSPPVELAPLSLFLLLMPDVDPQRPSEKPRLGVVVSVSLPSARLGVGDPRVRVRDLSTTSVTPLFTAPPMTPTALRPKVNERPTAAVSFPLGGKDGLPSSGRSSEVSAEALMHQGTTSMSRRSQPPARVMRWYARPWLNDTNVYTNLITNA